MTFSSLWFAVLAPAIAHAAAFPWALPEPTFFVPALDAWSPAPTPAPQLPGSPLFKRQQNGGNNTCGYVSGSIESSITCYATNAVCATNTYFGVQGCCNPTNLSGCVLPTTCIPSTALSTACTDLACSSNSAIAKCTESGLGECTQLRVVYPKTTMTQHGCAESKATLTVQRFLESPTSADGPKTVTVTAPPASSPTSSSSSGSSKSNIGAIVGGTVGGCVFLSIIAVAIFMCYRRRKPQRQSLQPAPRPVTHYHQPSMVEYDPVAYQNMETWGEEDIKLWQQHRKFQQQRPSGDYSPAVPMAHYPGMRRDDVLEVDGMERPIEAPS